ncbi:hypothetical protein CHLRE_09g389912v5 [Chlamydomonas reinhardtii]|uniref:Phospholipase A-2-activating protein n=1 Tax=Chlamydomonas reinhardtii TaxID=3055 RepID=A0A2K3DE20_CHLRE|nr:uncharacterized protein CHLRE_09g389912v5 [Chlamydomonas reinhardtii]PNW78780.1 hypothetical protein CHLRE_09g389912v5 [Chlamydomonas reinhardtii]
MAMEFKLRGELRGHDEDVRGVVVCPLGVLTGSRDKTVKVWAPDEATGSYSLVQTLVGHTDFVVAVLYVPPGANDDYPAGAIVSGSRDKTVRVWDPQTAACVAVLSGHEYQVTALGLLPKADGQAGGLVSASLDKTVRVWRDGKCAATLTGHEGPVLCLLVLPGGEILSGSGDTTVKMWAPGGGPCIHTIKAHTDTVRGMCLVPGLGFATASHDMSIKVWDSTGGVLAELVGHTAIVYCVAAVDAPAVAGGGVLLASGSEDNTVKLWRPNGDCLQTIEHPGCIWALDFAADTGDMLSGCSDAVTRVWAADPARAGPAELADVLAATLAARKAEKEAAAAQGGSEGAAGGGGGGGLPPGLKVEEEFALSQPGAKDGENKFIRNSATGEVAAYSWDAKAFQWEKIGVVVEGPAGGAGGAPGARPKKFHAGKEWDYVFDVDIAEGMPPRKLAMNEGDNEYLVASRFIEENELPPYFAEQIVQFIVQNTGGTKKTAATGAGPMDVTGGFCDPFTGGAGGGSRPQPQRPGFQLGGAAGAGPMDVTGGGVDPFTGGGGARSGALPAHSLTHVPCHTYLTFDNVPNLEALGRKIREFNGALAAPQQLTEPELAPGGALEALLAKLPKVASAATSPAAAAAAAQPGVIAAADVALLRRLLAWPADKLFPALDVARLAALDGGAGGGAELLAAPEVAGGLADAQPTPGTLAGALASAAASSLAANHQLALRLAANAVAAPGGGARLRSWALAGSSPLLDRLAPLAAGSTANKAVRLSAATYLGNLAAAVGLGHAQDPDLPLQALSACLELLSAVPSPLDEPDTAFRGLVAAGTLLVTGGRELCQIAKDLDIIDRIHAIMTAARGGGVAEQKLLQAGIDVSAVIARSTGVKVEDK